MLAMGVFTFDNWGNILNIPDDDLEEVLDTSLFPARQIRADWCNCNSEPEWMDFGRDSHPRHLVTNRCKVGPCYNGLEQCQDVNYTINVGCKIVNDNTKLESSVFMLLFIDSLSSPYSRYPCSEILIAASTKAATENPRRVTSTLEVLRRLSRWLASPCEISYPEHQ